MVTEVSIPSVIAEGTKIQGDLDFLSPTEIFGIIEGEVNQQCLEILRVGRTGWVHGKIRSQGPVVVEGKIDGDISSETRVSLCPTAVVRGKISAPCVEISAGAVVEGDVAMHGANPNLTKIAA
jgi:cytoskeletal protein CcmA (bactofilin family)